MPHIHEKYDFVTVAYIAWENTVLLVNHPKYGKWIPVGGHIELDEDPEQALFREILEETGLKVEILSTKPEVSSDSERPLLVPNYLEVHDANPPHQHINLIYFAKASNNRAKLSGEHTSLHWFTAEELLDKKYKLSPAVIFYSQEALKTAAKS